MSKEYGRDSSNVVPSLTSFTSNYLLNISIWMALRQHRLTTEQNSLTLTQNQHLFLHVQLKKKWHHLPHGQQSQKSEIHPRLCPLPLPTPHQFLPSALSMGPQPPFPQSEGRSLTQLVLCPVSSPSIHFSTLLLMFFVYADAGHISGHALN